MPRKKTTTGAPRPNADLLCVVILDKSGSMTAVRGQTISSYNEFKGTQEREGKKLGARTTWALTLFDTEVIAHAPRPVEDMPDLCEKTYTPSGCTALYDAVGETLSKLEKAHHKGELPQKVMIVIQTDGQENSSREWTQKAVFDLIGRLKALEMAVVFLGADQDAYVQGGALNIPQANTVSYDSLAATGQTFTMTSAATTNYRTGRSTSADVYAPPEPVPAEEEAPTPG